MVYRFFIYFCNYYICSFVKFVDVFVGRSEGLNTYDNCCNFCYNFTLSDCAVLIAELLTTSCFITVLVCRFYTKLNWFLCWPTIWTLPGIITNFYCCCVYTYNFFFNSLYLSTAWCTFNVALFITKFFLFYIYYEWSFINDHS